MRSDYLFAVKGQIVSDLLHTDPSLDRADEILELKLSGPVGTAFEELNGLGKAHQCRPKRVLVILWKDYSLFGPRLVFFRIMLVFLGSMLFFRFMLAFVSGFRLV